AGQVEAAAQELAQAGQHAVGQLDVPVHQGGDGLQGVEQEVRVQLGLEHLQLGLRQLGLELEGAQLALAELAVVEQAVGDAQDEPVDEDVEDQSADELGVDHLPDRP